MKAIIIERWAGDMSSKKGYAVRTSLKSVLCAIDGRDEDATGSFCNDLNPCTSAATTPSVASSTGAVLPEPSSP